MNSYLGIQLIIIITLSSALLTAAASQRSALAIDKESFKKQLLDKILSEEGDEPFAPASEKTANITNNIQGIKDKILEEAGLTLSKNEEEQVSQDDNNILKVHTAKADNNNCRSGDVLAGASNKKDLKVLSDCEEAIGIVKHAKKMNDGDYKLALKVRDKYKFLLNKINSKKTGGYLIVEIVPKDQKIKNVYLPKTGDRVDVWGAWVTDKPKGWHEIHPAWKVVKVK